MSEPQAELRLIAADPVAGRDLSSELERARRRVLVEVDRPGAPASGRRRGRRILPSAIAVTAAAVVLAALLPSSGGERPRVLPAPVEAFADELSGEGLLHLVTRTTAAIDRHGRRTQVPGEHVELWYDLDGPRWRLRSSRVGSPDYAEWVSDGRTLEVVSSAQGLRLRPDRLDPAMRLQLPPSWLPGMRSALAAGKVRIAGLATVRGQSAYRVALDLVPGDGNVTDTEVFVASDDSAMLRIDRWSAHLSPDSLPGMSRAEVLSYDVLPDIPVHRSLLDLSPALRRTSREDRPRFMAPTSPLPTRPPPTRAAPLEGST